MRQEPRLGSALLFRFETWIAQTLHEPATFSRSANLALACRRCNLLKGPNLSSVDPESDTMTRLFHPRTDSWREHFALQEHRIVGLTDVGRATVTLLEMNDLDRVQLRVELMELGLDAV